MKTCEEYICDDCIKCKLCSTPIRRKKKIGDGFVMAELGNYKEITLEFDDNSAHETCVCSECSYNIDIDKAQFLYQCDLAQWRKEGFPDQISKGYWQSLEARTVTGFKLNSRYGGR
jgi:hypothetical protein